MLTEKYIKLKIKALIDLSHQISFKYTQFKLATFKMNFITLSCSTEYFLALRKIDLQLETKTKK